MSRIVLVIVVVLLLALGGYFLLTQRLAEPICTVIRYDPCDNCSEYTVVVDCPPDDAPIMHFTSSGGLSFDGGGSSGGGSGNLIPQSDISEYDSELNCFTGVPTDDGLIRFTVDFYIEVPCTSVPDSHNPLCKEDRDNSPIVNDVTFKAKLFKNGEELSDPPDFDFSVRTQTGFESRSPGNFDLTATDYYYDCYPKQGVLTADCIATVRLSGKYELDPTSTYALAFTLKDHVSGHHKHSLSLIKEGCITATMLETLDHVFVDEDMQHAHRDVFSPEDIEKHLIALRDKGDIDRFIRANGNNALTNLASCYAKSDTLLEHYECLEESGCHIAAHTEIIYLPGLCSQ